MTELVFDIENNGFDLNTEITCLVIQDVDTGVIDQYYESENEILQGLLRLQRADLIIGHNIIGFDIPFIKSLYPAWTYKNRLDTLIASYLLYPERALHSLESYAKSSKFDKVQIDDWRCLTYEILDRCTLDVLLNTDLYISMVIKELNGGRWDRALALEQKVYEIYQKQLAKGVLVDQYKVVETIYNLDCELEPLRLEILKEAPMQVNNKGTINRVFKKNKDYMWYVQNFIDGG